MHSIFHYRPLLRPSTRNVIEAGVAVRVFTVNEENYAKALNDIGITAIFTDYPEKMMIYLNKKS